MGKNISVYWNHLSNLKKSYKYLKNLADIYLEYSMCFEIVFYAQNYYNLKEITPLKQVWDHGWLARWRKWSTCDIGEATEGF